MITGDRWIIIPGVILIWLMFSFGLVIGEPPHLQLKTLRDAMKVMGAAILIAGGFLLLAMFVHDWIWP